MPVCFSPRAGSLAQARRPCQLSHQAHVSAPGPHGRGRTRNRRSGAPPGPGGRIGVPGVAGSLLLPIPGRAAGIKQAVQPERVLISGRQLLGITLTEWFCLPAFSTVRRPRAMDQRRGGSGGRQRSAGRGGCADPAQSRHLPSPPPLHTHTHHPCPHPNPGRPGPQNLRPAQPRRPA